MLDKIEDRIREGVAGIILKLPVNITPNQITIISFVLGVLAGISFSLSNLLLATIMYYISDVIDGVDGIIARRKNQVTPYGAYLDSCLDRYVDVTVLLGICIHLSEFKYVWIIGIFAILGSFMRSYTTHRAEALNKIALTVPGISWHRRRRMHIIIAGALLSIYFPAALFYVLVIIAVIGNTYALCRIMPWMLKDFDTVDEQGKKHLPKTSIRKFQEQR